MGAIGRILTPYRLGRYAWRVWRAGRPAAKRRGISTMRLVREQMALKAHCGMRPDEYLFFGLDDPAMPWEEKLAFVSQEQGRRLWYQFTPWRYHYVFKNKLAAKHLLLGMGLPVAKLYGTWDPRWGRTSDGAPMQCARDIEVWQEKSGVKEFVVKPVESAEGRMVEVFKDCVSSGDSKRFVTLDDRILSAEDLCRHMQDPVQLRLAYPDVPPPTLFLFEERLHSHEMLRRFAPDTLSGTRVVTIVTMDGQVEVVNAVQKFQPRPIGRDNAAQGSVAVHIDLASGDLGIGRTEHDGPDVRLRALPGQTLEFTGQRLPFWPQVLEVARAAASACPFAHAIGWDIAITEKGPVIVEGNAAWGCFLNQMVSYRGLAQGSFKKLIDDLSMEGETR